jgi:hypothetical protein
MSAPGKLVRSGRWKTGPSKEWRPLDGECAEPSCWWSNSLVLAGGRMQNASDARVVTSKRKLTTDCLTCDNGQRAGDSWLDCAVRFHQLRTYREVGPRPRWATCGNDAGHCRMWLCGLWARQVSWFTYKQGRLS